jgi:hypothetical protein
MRVSTARRHPTVPFMNNLFDTDGNVMTYPPFMAKIQSSNVVTDIVYYIFKYLKRTFLAFAAGPFRLWGEDANLPRPLRERAGVRGLFCRAFQRHAWTARPPGFLTPEALRSYH